MKIAVLRSVTTVACASAGLLCLMTVHAVAGPEAVGEAPAGHAVSLDDIAIELVNPAGNLFAVANRFDYNRMQGSLPGADNQSSWNYALTPSFPIMLSNGSNIVLRATIPINLGDPQYQVPGTDYTQWRIRQEADTMPLDGAFDTGHGHLDDIGFDIAYGGVSDKGYVTQFGIAAVLPTSQDGSIERDQYLLGPELAFGKITDWGIIGARATHLVTVAETGGRDNDLTTNFTSLNFFFAYGLGNGWHIISNPEIGYDWEAAADNELLLPIGGGVSKTLSIAGFPLKADLELYRFIESPQAYGPEWLLTFKATAVLANRAR